MFNITASTKVTLPVNLNNVQKADYLKSCFFKGTINFVGEWLLYSIAEVLVLYLIFISYNKISKNEWNSDEYFPNISKPYKNFFSIAMIIVLFAGITAFYANILRQEAIIDHTFGIENVQLQIVDETDE